MLCAHTIQFASQFKSIQMYYIFTLQSIWVFFFSVVLLFEQIRIMYVLFGAIIWLWFIWPGLPVIWIDTVANCLLLCQCSVCVLSLVFVCSLVRSLAHTPNKQALCPRNMFVVYLCMTHWESFDSYAKTFAALFRLTFIARFSCHFKMWLAAMRKW